MSHVVPVIVCEATPKCSCGERIQLPYSTRQQKAARQPNQPKADWILNFVCPKCGFRADYNRTHIQWPLIPEGVRAEGLPGTVLWKIEFECARESCGIPVVTHTTGFQDASQFFLLSIVERAYPPLYCDKKHDLSFPAIVKSLDIVEEAW